MTELLEALKSSLLKLFNEKAVEEAAQLLLELHEDSVLGFELRLDSEHKLHIRSYKRPIGRQPKDITTANYFTTLVS